MATKSDRFPVEDRWRDGLRLTAALLWILFGGLHGLLFMSSFNSVPAEGVRIDAYAPALLEPEGDLPRDSSADKARVRLALVVVDGLRADMAPTLGLSPPASLPAASCVLQAGWPSYSRASYATLGTGAPPSLSGVHTNRYDGPVLLDSLFARARAAGLLVFGVTDRVDWWAELFPTVWGLHATDPEAFAHGVAQLFREGAPGLALVHTVIVDGAGHEHGASSPAYAAAVAASGAWLQKVLERMDPERDVLLVTSDHGHMMRGGHGGPDPDVLSVPLLAYGRGIRPGAGGAGCGGTVNVAATAAVLLGIAPPRHATGEPLWQILDLPDAAVRTARAAVGARRFALARSLGGVGDDLEQVLPSWRRPRPQPVIAALGLFLLLGALLLVLGAGWLPGDSPWQPELPGRGWRILLIAAVFPLLFGVAYPLTEAAFSFSTVWDRDPWLAWIVGRCAVLAVFSYALHRALQRRRPLDEIRLQQSAALWLTALPWMLAAGVHGSIWGGPQLGHPGAAWGLLVADFVLVWGGIPLAVRAAQSLLGRDGRLAVGRVSPGRTPAPADRSTPAG